MALEMTGLPSIRRSAAAFASGDPGTGTLEGVQGGIGVLSLAAGMRGARGAAPRAPQPPRSITARAPDAGNAGGGRVVYRGLNRPYDPANGGYYQSFTSSLDDAREYGPNVIAARINPGRNLAVDGGGNNFNALSVEQLPTDVRARLHPSIGQSATTDQIAHAAREAGYDSVTVRNVHDNRWGERPARGSEPRTIDFVFDTRNVSPLDQIPAQQTSAVASAEKVKLSVADRALLDELFADDPPTRSDAARAAPRVAEPAPAEFPSFGSEPQWMDAYRGLKQPFNAERAAGRVEWWADNPDTAWTYARSNNGGNIIPGRINTADFLEVDADGNSYLAVPVDRIGDPRLRAAASLDGKYDTAETNRIARVARENGYDGIVFRNIRDDSEGVGPPGNVVAVLNPERRQSRFGPMPSTPPKPPASKTTRTPAKSGLFPLGDRYRG